MKTKKRTVILGATGSVGQTVLREIAAYRDSFEVVGVSCHQNIPLAERLVQQFSVENVCVTGTARGIRPKIRDARHVFYGIDGMCAMISAIDFDVLVVAISGIDGLKPTLRAIERGKDIILASKEILVTAGSMVMRLAEQKKVQILPLDSEHNAIFQCTRGDHRYIRKLQLTASGGCFWNRESLDNIRLEEVLKHPQWSMGKKITVDSSTMANKGLEIMEAMHLFDVAPERIEVLIHPDCVVHSLVEFTDGSFLAQLSSASMRYAARFCLFYPERCQADFSQEASLNLVQLKELHFFEPDFEKFPCLRLAYHVARQKQSMQIAYNASNEVAVALFLAKKIAFQSIPKIIENTLEKVEDKNYETLEEILAVDQMVRSHAQRFARKLYL